MPTEEADSVSRGVIDVQDTPNPGVGGTRLGASTAILASLRGRHQPSRGFGGHELASGGIEGLLGRNNLDPGFRRGNSTRGGGAHLLDAPPRTPPKFPPCLSRRAGTGWPSSPSWYSPHPSPPSTDPGTGQGAHGATGRGRLHPGADRDSGPLAGTRFVSGCRPRGMTRPLIDPLPDRRPGSDTVSVTAEQNAALRRSAVQAGLGPAGNRSTPASGWLTRSQPIGVFGVDVFRRSSTQFLPAPLRARASRLSAGARRHAGTVFLTGDVELTYQLGITREGFVVIPQVGQVYLANLTLAQARSTLYDRLGRVYSGSARGGRHDPVRPLRRQCPRRAGVRGRGGHPAGCVPDQRPGASPDRTLYRGRSDRACQPAGGRGPPRGEDGRHLRPLRLPASGRYRGRISASKRRCRLRRGSRPSGDRDRQRAPARHCYDLADTRRWLS